MEMMSNLDALMEFTKELRGSLPRPKDKPVVVRPITTLYNIHKRSKPEGTDKIIIVGLLRDEADLEVMRLIKYEQRRRNEMVENNVFYYFDIVPMEATKEEKSIYYNEGPLLMENK